MARQKKHTSRYELITCSWKGHALVGTDAAEVTEEDATFVRQGPSGRWYRCLRCDAWIPQPAPVSPTAPAARARFPTNVTLFGHTLSIAVELAIVVVFALVFFVLAFRGLSRTE